MGTVRTRRGPSRVPLVLDAELTGRIGLADARAPRGGDVTGILLGLGLVDGDLEVAPGRGRRPCQVAGDGRALDVVGVTAELVEPIRRRLGAVDGLQPVEVLRHVGRARHEGAHHARADAVPARGGVLDDPVLHRDLGERVEKPVDLADRNLTRKSRIRGTVGANALEHAVVSPSGVPLVEKEVMRDAPCHHARRGAG